MAVTYLAVIFACAISLITAHAPVYPQVPLQSEFPGFPYSEDPDSLTAQVRIDVFLEINCGSSKYASEVLPGVVQHYGAANLSVVIHQFMMPYHRYGFQGTQAFYQMVKRCPGEKFYYMTQVFSHLDDFRDGAVDSTWYDIARLYAADAHTVCPAIDEADFALHLDDSEFWWSAYNAYKYGLRRGAAGTPWFFINGIEIGGPTLTEQDWIETLDPLYADI